MTFTFLQEEFESLLLFATAPVYFIIIGILQSKNLKILKELKRKSTGDTVKSKLTKDLRKLKRLIPVFMLIGITIHLAAYICFVNDEFRSGYFISMIIIYVIYVLIARVNFYLKGAGVLKDIGGFNGLPGN